MSSQNVTQILRRIREEGDTAAFDELLPLVHDQLRELARAHMRRERSDHTLQATALVSEAYLKLVDVREVEFTDRAHFFAVAARCMRRILIDHARRRQAGKRGGEWDRVTLDAAEAIEQQSGVDLLDMHEALKRLAGEDERKARVVELRFFGGLTNREVAAALGVAEKTAEADWYFARAWLRRELARD